LLFTKLALGVDWSSSGINVVALGRRFRRLVVVDGLHLPDPLEEGARSKVEGFLKKNQAGEARGTVCLPREAVLVRFLDLPAEVEPQLEKVVSYQIDTLHPFQGTAVCWDSAVVSRDLKAKQIRVLVAIAERSRIDWHHQALKNLGLRVDSLSLMASHLAPLLKGSLPETALLVCGRTKSLELVGFHQGCLCATRELSLETSDAPAVQFERELHSLWSVLPTVDPSMLPIFTCGTLPAVLSEMLTGAKALPPLRSTPASPPNFDIRAHLPALAAAYAGLRRRPATSLNLLPPEFRQRPRRGARVPLYALGATAACLGLLMATHGVIETALYGRALERAIQQLTPQAEAARGQKQQVTVLTERIGVLEGVRAETWRKLQILEELTRLLPDGTWVQDLQLGQEVVEITGYSNRAAELIQPLENSPYFSQVEFTSPITRDAQNKEIFRIRMRLGKPARR
jgi:Tfp pilus assembly protein PilN